MSQEQQIVEQQSGIVYALATGENVDEAVGKNAGINRVLPSMEVIADITTGKKPRLESLLKGVVKALSESFPER